jgi:putative hydrolase of the HAD superfamily
MRAEAVFFDVGSTLIYPEPPVAEVYAGALRRAGIPAETAAMAESFRAAWSRRYRDAARETAPYGSTEEQARAWWRRIVWESFEPFGRPGGFESLFDELWSHFARGEAWRLYEDVGPVLDGLKARGKPCGVISNWDARLTGVLRELGLLSRLEWVVASFEVGVEKPHRGIFEEALARAGLPAGRVVHVGDSYEDDYLGARAAGLGAIWLDRAGAGPPGPQVTRVTSLTEAARLIL